jgi:AraC-like DNA-binding protein
MVMGFVVLDAMLRGAAIALFLVLCILFVREARQSVTARLGALLTVGGACYVALILIDATYGFPNPWRLPVHFMSLATPALFWPFAASWFDDEFEWRWYHGALVVATIVAGVVANFMQFVMGSPLAAIGLGWRALSLLSIALGLRATLKGWSSDLVESRRRVRIALVGVVAASIVWIVFSEFFWVGWPPPMAWRVGNASVMFALAAIVALATLGWRDIALLAAPPKPVDLPDRPEADDSGLLARLEADMRHDRLYRQEGLTITAVAARLGVPEYRLRRAINQGLGARNFNAYLNGFRLDETREALADPAQRDVPILTIALDAGFGSLAPFNRAFREAEGCTPTEYRAKRTRG